MIYPFNYSAIHLSNDPSICPSIYPSSYLSIDLHPSVSLQYLLVCASFLFLEKHRGFKAFFNRKGGSIGTIPIQLPGVNFISQHLFPHESVGREQAAFSPDRSSFAFASWLRKRLTRKTRFSIAIKCSGT